MKYMRCLDDHTSNVGSFPDRDGQASGREYPEPIPTVVKSRALEENRVARDLLMSMGLTSEQLGLNGFHMVDSGVNGGDPL